MAKRDFGDERRFGSVKAAIDMYGGRSCSSSSAFEKLQNDLPESSSVAKQLHKSRKEIRLYQESRKAAESVKAEAESELSNAKRMVKELTLLIGESSSKAMAQKRDIATLKRQKERVMTARNTEDSEYVVLMRELESVKQELSKLKLDIGLVFEEKLRAENKMEESSLKIESNLRSVESLRKEIEMVNEEQVLVELARIEALKEYGEIEAQREKKTSEFLAPFEERRKKIMEMMEQIEESKEIEDKLSVTLSDVEMLETQLKLVKEMERRAQRNDSLGRPEDTFQRDEDNLSVLKELTEELEAKKEEFSSIKAEGFQFMTSMDAIRKELIQIKEETARLDKVGDKADLKIQNLNSKLLRAKSKLKAITASEERVESVAANLSASLDQLKIDTEATKKENLLIEEETDAVRAEKHRTEFEIDEKEGNLLSKLRELEEVKSSEALALEKLESLVENAMEARASASQHGSTITISRFEYDYLTGRAIQAKDIADRKVAAAEAWVEALKASEKEISMKTEMLKRENGKTTVEEERKVYRTQMCPSAKKMVEKEIQKWKQKHAKSMEMEDFSGRHKRKSLRGNVIGKFSQTPRPKFTKSFSAATRATPTYFVIKKRRKVPNLVKFLSGKSLFGK